MSPPRALGPVAVAVPTCTPRMSAAWASWGLPRSGACMPCMFWAVPPRSSCPNSRAQASTTLPLWLVWFGGVFIKLSVDFYIWGGGPFDKWNTHPWRGVDGCPLSGDTPKPT